LEKSDWFVTLFPLIIKRPSKHPAILDGRLLWGSMERALYRYDSLGTLRFPLPWLVSSGRLNDLGAAASGMDAWGAAIPSPKEIRNMRP
jgi:hypothetical protein